MVVERVASLHKGLGSLPCTLAGTVQVEAYHVFRDFDPVTFQHHLYLKERN